MLELTVTEEFLGNYRQYKIDLLEGIVEEDICYKTLEYILDNNDNTELTTLYEYLDGYEWVKIDVATNEITDHRSNPKVYEPGLDDFDFDM